MKRTLLHVGCGPKRKNQTTPGFDTPEWDEVRLDIDPKVGPDIVGTMTNMAAVQSASVDAVFSSHNVEHLYPHEVPVAFAEFKRVLRPEGFVVITCPDVQSACALVAEDKLTEPAYQSRSGPIAPMDILFGQRSRLAAGNLFMAHHCGFTQRVLGGSLRQAGFASVALKRRIANFDLWALATMQPMREAELLQLSALHFPA